MNRFQKITFFCLVSLIALVFVGAFVRATGAGMGCPDWPFCWGKAVPPMSVEEVDVATLVEKEAFIREYKNINGANAVLTEEALRGMFNPQHTWTEYINRLFSMPIGLGSLALLAYALHTRSQRVKSLLVLAFVSLGIVLANAIMGALVVRTGLKEGVITAHMALAILLLCILMYMIWAGGDERKRYTFSEKHAFSWKIGLVLFALIAIEGVMGSQVRELTDALQKSHGSQPRIEWLGELEQSWVYLVHRSFSWVIVLLTVMYAYVTCKHKVGGFGWVEAIVVGVILAQMVLGLLLAQLGIYPVVQILHIGLSSILITAMFYWLLCASRKKSS